MHTIINTSSPLNPNEKQRVVKSKNNHDTFAVTPILCENGRFSTKEFTITHVPTGLSLSKYIPHTSIKQQRRNIELLLHISKQLGANWNFGNTVDSRQNYGNGYTESELCKKVLCEFKHNKKFWIGE